MIFFREKSIFILKLNLIIDVKITNLIKKELKPMNLRMILIMMIMKNYQMKMILSKIQIH